MGVRIPDAAIQDIRERTNLVELISEKTSLRRRGRNHVGLCPFHAENTASFTVSEERGFFHCFGCGASGNAFGWMMRTEQMSFPEAVRWLAARAGVELPAETADRGDHRADDLLYRVNESAAAYYEWALWDAALGMAARAYLATRGIPEPVARQFRLGFAPASGDAFVRRARSLRLPVDAQLGVGLVGRRSDGTLFDRFRARLMFPITDARGRVSGFGGRVLPEAPGDGPKYLNSPESPVFRKRQLLYGLREARDAIRRQDRAVLVEGYLDVLALHQHGLEVAVAPLGTAVSAEQLRYLRRYSGNVTACFDGDEAGVRAAGRSFGVFVEAGLWGRAAVLPSGEDPDSFVRTQGTAAFERLLVAAPPLVDLYLKGLVDPDDLSVTRRVQVARDVGRLLRRVRNPWEYDLLARLAAERLGVREELLRGENRPPTGAVGGAGSVTSLRKGSRTGGEAMLIELMLTGRDAIDRVAHEGGAGLFEDPEWRELGAAILEQARVAGDPGTLVERLPAEMRERVAAALLGEGSDEESRARMVGDCLEFIRRRQRRRQARRLLEEIRAAETAGDETRIREGLQQWRALVAPGSATAPGSVRGQE